MNFYEIREWFIFFINLGIIGFLMYFAKVSYKAQKDVIKAREAENEALRAQINSIKSTQIDNLKNHIEVLKAKIDLLEIGQVGNVMDILEKQRKFIDNQQIEHSEEIKRLIFDNEVQQNLINESSVRFDAIRKNITSLTEQLHDNVAQALCVLKIILVTLDDKIIKGQELSRDDLQNIHHLVDEAMDEVGNLIRNVHPFVVGKGVKVGGFLQLHSMHSYKNGSENKEKKAKDLGGIYVLISNKFHYFGSKAPELPGKLFNLKVGRAHRNRFSKDVISRFYEFIATQPKGIIGPPSKWPPNDLSWQWEHE